MMMRKRIPMEASLRHQSLPASFRARTVRSEDKDSLAILLLAAYRGSADDEGESFADARSEIEKTWNGDYGRFLPGCSFVVEEGEFLASACLVSYFEPHGAPLVVFLMTRPEAKRRGLARRLLQHAMNALLREGYGRLTLVVTLGNEPAQRLYDSLGFAPIPEPPASGGSA
jgi:ribosomal protein S18 acetylase RimI-like enzyme